MIYHIPSHNLYPFFVPVITGRERGHSSEVTINNEEPIFDKLPELPLPSITQLLHLPFDLIHYSRFLRNRLLMNVA